MLILKLVIGLVLLVVGAELLVRGAARIAAVFGISSLVIGLTVVAFGTSSPELGVSLMSAFAGSPDVAVGNVVGSNIFNVLLILGLSAMITPLIVAQQLIRLDVPVMIGVSVLVVLFTLDGSMAQWEGLILVLLGIAYTWYIIRQSRKETNAQVIQEYEAEFGATKKRQIPLPVAVLFILAGLGCLVLGAKWLVDGAVFLAHQFGVSDLVIGLTIIAAGTSLPEVATSVVASIRGERDIAVGNVVGSNIFNIVFILGITSGVSPGGIPIAESARYFDLPVMTAVALACLPIFFTGHRLDRWEGGVFLFYYVAYTTYLILSASSSDALPMFAIAMKWFVLPLTALTLVIVTAKALRSRSTRHR